MKTVSGDIQHFCTPSISPRLIGNGILFYNTITFSTPLLRIQRLWLNIGIIIWTFSARGILFVEWNRGVSTYLYFVIFFFSLENHGLCPLSFPRTPPDVALTYHSYLKIYPQVKRVDCTLSSSVYKYIFLGCISLMKWQNV